MIHEPTRDNERQYSDPVSGFIESVNEYFRDHAIELEHEDDGDTNVSWFESDGDLFNLTRVTYFATPSVGVLREFLPEKLPSTYDPTYHICDWTLVRYSRVEGSSNEFEETIITYDEFAPGYEFLFQKSINTYDPGSGELTACRIIETLEDPEDPSIRPELLGAIDIIGSPQIHRSISEERLSLPYVHYKLEEEKTRKHFESVPTNTPPESRFSPELRAKVSECRRLAGELLQDYPRKELWRRRVFKLSNTTTIEIRSRELVATDRSIWTFANDEYYGFEIWELMDKQTNNSLYRIDRIDIEPDETVKFTQNYEVFDKHGNRIPSVMDEKIEETVRSGSNEDSESLPPSEPMPRLSQRASSESDEDEITKQLINISHILKTII